MRLSAFPIPPVGRRAWRSGVWQRSALSARSVRAALEAAAFFAGLILGRWRGSGHGVGLRVTELLGSISLATDPGAGQPLAHVVRSDGLATAIAAELGFPVVKIEV